MIRIHPKLYIGNETDCTHNEISLYATVHACKYPCWAWAVGQPRLTQNHKNYLQLETPNNLYLNIIDPAQPLFRYKTFTLFLDFAHREWQEGKDLLIHCNKGESRAPSLALLFLAKYANAIPVSQIITYDHAAAEFAKLYPQYKPGLGIQTFLRDNWSKLITH